jgi:hypothetical protein
MSSSSEQYKQNSAGEKCDNTFDKRAQTYEHHQSDDRVGCRHTLVRVKYAVGSDISFV